MPDYDLIQVLRWFHANGDTVYVWSAGGIEYADNIVRNLGLEQWVTVIAKESRQVDITFDDMPVTLGKVNIQVKRPVVDN